MTKDFVYCRQGLVVFLILLSIILLSVFWYYNNFISHYENYQSVDVYTNLNEDINLSPQFQDKVLLDLQAETQNLAKFKEKGLSWLANHRSMALKSEVSDHQSRYVHSHSVQSQGGLPLFGKSATRQRSQDHSNSNSEATKNIGDVKASEGFTGEDTDSFKGAYTKQGKQSLHYSTFTEDELWASGLFRKLKCLRHELAGILLFHIRKAAGTSMREVLSLASERWRVPLFETEGLTLDARFLAYRSKGSNDISRAESTLADFAAESALLSVILLRHPVDRILSLYWYEHVGWFDGIQKRPEKCAPLRSWIDYWRDSSDTKKKFSRSNPYNVYVEIENYYIKSLIGWKATAPIGGDGAVTINDLPVARSRAGTSASAPLEGPVTEQHLELAKRVLDAFDVVLLTEWLSASTTVDAMNALFPGRAVVAAKQLLKSDPKAKERLRDRLAPPAETALVVEALTAMNRLDIELFQYAQTLAARRLAQVPALVSAAADVEFVNQCGARLGKLPPELDAQLGVHRPPGHKAPLL